MMSAVGINNIRSLKNFRQLLKINFIDKKVFPTRCFSIHASTVSQTEPRQGSYRRCSLLNCPRLSFRSCLYNISNCYSSNGAVRYKSDGVESTDGNNLDDPKQLNISKDDVLKIINKFYVGPQIRDLSERCGLKGNFFHKAFIAFRRHCVEQELLPSALVDILDKIHAEQGQVEDIFSHFMTFAKTQFPHLNYIEELRQFSDLREPAKWYPEARSKQRKVIYHAGPTNSGKTYHALQRFLSAKSGVYCGPLRLLAVENFKKANAKGTPCDLITGEDRKYVSDSGEPSSHQACTVEMTNLSQPYEVAVIDEIQLVRDTTRGWAWTRAFLGLCADEIHVCGEESGVGLIHELCTATGDEFEIQRYKRLTPLTVLDTAVENFDNVQPGDCIVCFNKNDIFAVCKELEARRIESAVIYGTMPPATKIAHAEKFNNPQDPCKVMVATDAVGMGLNLNIKRMIFYSVMKPSSTEVGKMDFIPPSTALQIAGRAGRFNTQFANGEVTTFKGEDLPALKELLSTSIEPIQKAGLAPTSEQIELYNLCLPDVSLVDTVDIFSKLCEIDDSRYFMCDLDNFRFLAGLLEDMPIKLRHMYAFCCAPISERQGLTCSMFVKFARQFSKGIPMTLDWVCHTIGWPFKNPANIKDLMHLEEVYDVFDLYHWLSYRFPDLFPHTEPLAKIQARLDEQIRQGVEEIIRKLEGGEKNANVPTPEFQEKISLPRKKFNHPIQLSIIEEIKEEDTRSKSNLATRFLTAQEQVAEMEKKRAENLERLNLGKEGGIGRRLVSDGILTRRILNLLQQELALELSDKRRSGSSTRSDGESKPTKGKS